MSDTTLRHLISFLATLAAIIIYVEGYFSGARGWWWTVIVLMAVYFIVYKLVEV